MWVPAALAGVRCGGWGGGLSRGPTGWGRSGNRRPTPPRLADSPGMSAPAVHPPGSRRRTRSPQVGVRGGGRRASAAPIRGWRERWGRRSRTSLCRGQGRGRASTGETSARRAWYPIPHAPAPVAACKGPTAAGRPPGARPHLCGCVPAAAWPGARRRGGGRATCMCRQGNVPGATRPLHPPRRCPPAEASVRRRVTCQATRR
jgi:hypothetical protein